MPARLIGIIALACLIAPAIAIAGDKFQIAAEKRVPPIPHLSPFGKSPFDPNDYGAVSPDGRSALILKAGRLTIRPLEAEEEKQILPQGSIPEGGAAYWACWSADGQWIYYLQPEGDAMGRQNLWRVGIASLDKERLVKNASRPFSVMPRPSPDGKSIVFHRGQALMITGADGRGERVLLERGYPRVDDMVWSPDSSQILMARYSGDLWRLNLVTVSTGQVKSLTPWAGPVNSIIWPSWSSGPFLCFWPLDQAAAHRHPLPPANYQIWHLSLPQEERTQLTREPTGSFIIFGAGPTSYSLVAARAVQPSGWNNFLSFLGRWGLHAPDASDFQTTLLLTLRK